MKEEYEPQQFLLENYTQNRNSVADVIAERTINRCIQLSAKTKDLQIESQPKAWKNNLDAYLELEQSRIMHRVQNLENKQSLAVQFMRKLSKTKI